MEIRETNEKTNAWVQEVLDNRWTDTARVLKVCATMEQEAGQSKDAWLLGFAY